MSAHTGYNRYLLIAAVVAVAALAVWAVAAVVPRSNGIERLLADLNSDEVATRLAARRKIEAIDRGRGSIIAHLCAETERRRVEGFADRFFELRPDGQDYLYYRTPPDAPADQVAPRGTYVPQREDDVRRHAARLGELADTIRAGAIEDWLDADGKADLRILLDMIAVDIDALNGLTRYDPQKPPLPQPPRADGFAPPVGRERFQVLLRSREMIDDSPEALYDEGQALMRSIQRQMAEVAESIRPGATPHEVLRDLSMDYPPAGTMAALAESEWRAALRFVRDKKIAPIPPGSEYIIVTDEADPRSLAPYGAYGRATPWWEKKFVGDYIINSGAGLKGDALIAHLRSNNRLSTRVKCVHETFPGHHLQQAYEWAHSRSRLRKMAACQSYFEGWAMYAEQLMDEHGYYDTPQARLVYLQHRLWRAARVVIDAGYHTGRVSAEEGIRLLTDVVGLDARGARLEMERYAASPTQALCYMVGCRRITEIRKEYKAKKGDAYSESEFHQRFLELGSMPLPLVRDILLSD
jgi:hypothetical protein